MKTTDKNEKALNIKIPEKLYSELKATAQRKNISLASVVRMLCSEGLERGGQPAYGKYETNSSDIYALKVSDKFNVYDYVPKKERLIVQRLRDFIEDDDYPIALVAGIRKVGKTTVLKQLLRHYGKDAYYIDLTQCSDIDFMDFIHDYAKDPVKILLLDEFTHLDDYENTGQLFYNLSGRNGGCKIIMTGSSSAHITKLSSSKLGGGRARLMRLPPITFIEYLYLTGRISGYDNYENVTNADFADYLLLKDIPKELSIQFDDDYFQEFYNEVCFCNETSELTDSFVEIKDNDLQHLSNLIAYKLSEATSYDKAIGDKLTKNKIGRREYNSLKSMPDIETPKWGKIDLSDAFITESHDAAQAISTKDKARTLLFMLRAGLASIEFKKMGKDEVLPDSRDILVWLKDCSREQDLRDLFKNVSICLTSPLFYTRLGKDIVSRMGVNVENLCRGDLLGKMLEVYIRGAVTIRKANRIMSTIKLDYDDLGEVDIFEEFSDLLLEITCRDKKADEVNLQNYFQKSKLIRVCTTDKTTAPYGCYHRIPYAKLCCMLDTGDVYKLEKTRASDVLG